MIKKAKKIWMNGKLVPWEKAKVHFLTHALHYGTGVFEGIRCYNTEKGPAIFRLDAHIERLFDSEKIIGFKVPYSKKKVREAVVKTIKANKLKECYIRPLVYFGYGKMGLNPIDCKIDIGIACWEWPTYLGKKGIENGIRAKVSSYARDNVNISLTKGKITGNYINSALAKVEAIRSGYDEAVMLDAEGFVSECSAENLFIVRDGVVLTVPKATILEGITRDSIIKIAKDLRMPCREEMLTRDQLYIADEAFMTGTAAEVTPMVEIDNRKIGSGKPGAITKKLQNAFFGIVRGENPKYKKWLTYVK